MEVWALNKRNAKDDEAKRNWRWWKRYIVWWVRGGDSDDAQAAPGEHAQRGREPRSPHQQIYMLAKANSSLADQVDSMQETNKLHTSMLNPKLWNLLSCMTLDLVGDVNMRTDYQYLFLKKMLTKLRMIFDLFLCALTNNKAIWKLFNNHKSCDLNIYNYITLLHEYFFIWTSYILLGYKIPNQLI